MFLPIFISSLIVPLSNGELPIIGYNELYTNSDVPLPVCLRLRNTPSLPDFTYTEEVVFNPSALNFVKFFIVPYLSILAANVELVRIIP